jgi:hypothetical protein
MLNNNAAHDLPLNSFTDHCTDPATAADRRSKAYYAFKLVDNLVIMQFGRMPCAGIPDLCCHMGGYNLLANVDNK